MVCGILAVSCQSSPKTANPDFTQAEIDSVSQAIGYSLASMVKQSNFGDLNTTAIMNSFKEYMNKTEEASQTDMMQWSQQIQSYMQKKGEREGQRNIEQGKAFLEENKTKEGVVELPSGLQYKILNAGNDLRATESDTVEVNYVGTLIDGTEFDSSYSRNEPAKFPLNRVIRAWTEGMQLIGEGGKIILYVPSELGYGANGAGNKIGPNSTLIFEVEMNKIFPAVVKEETK